MTQPIAPHLESISLHVVLATFHGCPQEVLNDANHLSEMLSRAVHDSGLTLLHKHVHQFSPVGVTGTAVLAESHIAFHSWPNEGLLFVDIATCSTSAATEAAFRSIQEMIPHEETEVRRSHLGSPQ